MGAFSEGLGLYVWKAAHLIRCGRSSNFVRRSMVRVMLNYFDTPPTVGLYQSLYNVYELEGIGAGLMTMTDIAEKIADKTAIK